MRNPSATHNLTAVSASNSELAINQDNAVDLSILCDLGDIAKLNPRREDNSDEANGREEADTIYDNGATSEASFTHNRAQPQHFAFLYAFGLGDITTVASGDGYLHTIKPLDGGVDLERELPSFTLLAKLGGIFKRRYASMFVDSISATFAADDWVKVSGSIKGTGKHEDNVVSVSVTALGNATSLTLPTASAGDSALEMLDSIHEVKAELSPGTWTDVQFSAVAGTNLTIVAPSDDGDPVTYKVLYVPVESSDFTFPGRIIESPLRVAEMTMQLGGQWNGTEFEGGRRYGAEIKSISHSVSNNSKIQFVPGGGGAFASMHERGGRTQSLKLDRSFRDFIMQQHIKDNDTFGAKIVLMGPEFADGENYKVEIIFPRLGLMSASFGASDKKLTESGDLKVLEDPQHGSVIVKVTNQWPNYAR